MQRPARMPPMHCFAIPAFSSGSVVPIKRPLTCVQRPPQSDSRSARPLTQIVSGLSSPLGIEGQSLNGELHKLLGKKHLREAVTFLENELQGSPTGVLPIVDYRDLHHIIAVCAETNRWELALRTFRVIEALGYSIARSTSCLLFKMLKRAGRTSEAENVLNCLWDPEVTLADGTIYRFDAREMSRRIPDEKMVTQVANFAVDDGKPDAAIRMLLFMRENGIPMTMFSVSVLIKAYGRQGRPDMVERVLENMLREPDVIVFNSAIDAYIRCKERHLAMKVLHNMSTYGLTPNARSYNPILRQLARGGKVDEAFALRDEMVERGIEPSPRTINSLIHACVCAKDWTRAHKVLLQAVEVDPDPRTRVTKDLLVGYTTIISGLASEGNMRTAEQLLQDMVESVQRSGRAADFDADIGIALTAILSALLAQDEFVRAWILFRSIRKRFKIRLPPDTYNAVISGLAKRGDKVSIEAAGRVFEEMMEVFGRRKKRRDRKRTDGIRGDVSMAAVEATALDISRAYNAMMDGFVRMGDTTSGEELLDQMEDSGHEPTVVTYTTLINGYGKEGDLGSVRRVFRRMRAASISPDLITMNALLGACVRSGDVELAERVLKEMKQVGGRIAPNLVSYSAMIAGYLRTEKREEAWMAYDEMKRNGISPNERVLDRMMAAFVCPQFRPSRSAAWADDSTTGASAEARMSDGDTDVAHDATGDDEDDGVIEVTDDDDETGEDGVTDDDEDEEGMKSLRTRLLQKGGWASTRAAELLKDMQRCDCTEVARQRWRRALEAAKA